jgi:hypothetical protein
MFVRNSARILSSAIVCALLFACQDASTPPAATYSVIYVATDKTSGSVPVDSNKYEARASITVAYPGTLQGNGLSFDSWNTAQDASGTRLLPDQTYSIGSSDLYLYAQWIDPSNVRAQGITPTDEIGFYVSGGSGATFTPMIELGADATVQWYFTGYGGGAATGETASSSLTPSITCTGTMLATLKVTPWSALKTIDMGYDGGDDGVLPTTTYKRDPQNLTAVQHLGLAKGSLDIWCSSHNTGLTSLSFSGFSKLKTIESFFSDGDAVGLASIDLSGTSALTRLCVEDNQLASLDLSDCVSLEDLRAASNAYPSITWPASMPNLWHVCIHDNPFDATSAVPVERMPALSECWLWNDRLAGAFAPNSQVLTNIQIDGTTYTSIDLTAAKFATDGNLVNASGSPVASVHVGASGVNILNLNGCKLEAAAIATLIQDLATSNDDLTGGTLTLTGNPGNIETSSPYYTSLTTTRGWTIYR